MRKGKIRDDKIPDKNERRGGTDEGAETNTENRVH